MGGNEAHWLEVGGWGCGISCAGSQTSLGAIALEAPASRMLYMKRVLPKTKFPNWSVTAIKISRHSGMDRGYPDCMEAPKPRRPWSLGSGDPCRNDEVFFLNLMPVKLEHGKEQ